MLQSQLRQVRVYINKKVNETMTEEQNAWNIFIVKTIILKGKTHNRKINVDVRDDIRKIISLWRVFGKHGPVQIIGNSY